MKLFNFRKPKEIKKELEKLVDYSVKKYKKTYKMLADSDRKPKNFKN